MATIEAKEPAEGEFWAYRASFQYPLVQVRVARHGVKTPKRILVHFVDDEFEGQQDWVPPARLKVPWEHVDAFIEKERRWDSVASATPGRDSPDVSAAGIVFDLLIHQELAELGYNATMGVIKIHDAERLAALLDLGPDDLRADATAFEEDGVLVASWTTTKMLAVRAAQRDPHRVLGYVEREEADARRDAIYGRSYPTRGKSQAWDVSPEICAQVDDEHGKPVRSILRDWSGQEPIDLRNEIRAYQMESTRLAKLASAALEALRQAGHTRRANAIEKQHTTVGVDEQPG